MNIPLILVIGGVTVGGIVLLAIILRLAGNDLLKLNRWTIRLYYWLIPINLCFSVYDDLREGSLFNDFKSYLFVLIFILCLMFLLLIDFIFKRNLDKVSRVQQQIGTLNLLAMIGLPTINVAYLIDRFIP